ncbi:MAG: hypothetical protein J6J70_02080 [Methanocorpusculaceae archaeon]|nr:hypothetical protein [Methanocorpusculaceae archaeon]
MVDKTKREERVSFRLDGELLKKLNVICDTENKKISSVAFDACLFYAELYPFLHALKSKKLYPQLTINEEVIKEEIFTALKKLV